MELFYYLGAKNRLSAVAPESGGYPEPLYDTIIEPFAGSAGYAQRWRRNASGALRTVILVEKDPVVCGLWKELQGMAAGEILALPTPEAGTYCENGSLLDRLVKVAAHSNGPAHMTGPLKVPSRVAGIWRGMLRRMAERVDDVRYWTIVCADYTVAPDIEATWFIDPPYRLKDRAPSRAATPAGRGYKCDDRGIDYDHLVEWCLTRRGQVIAADHGESWVGSLVNRGERMSPPLRGRDGDYVKPRTLKSQHDSQGRPNRETCVEFLSPRSL